MILTEDKKKELREETERIWLGEAPQLESSWAQEYWIDCRNRRESALAVATYMQELATRLQQMMDLILQEPTLQNVDAGEDLVRQAPYPSHEVNGPAKVQFGCSLRDIYHTTEDLLLQLHCEWSQV